MRSKYFGAMLGLLCAAPMVAGAQNATPPAVAVEGAATTTMKIIRLQNVPADVIAWWIDPAHQPEPLIYTQSRNMMQGNGAPMVGAWPNASMMMPPRSQFSAPTGTNPYAPPTTAQDKAAGGGLFDLRQQGVDSIAPDLARGELIVRGTPQSIAAVEGIVAFLDKPLRQVEIETQIVQLSAADVAALGADFTSVNGPIVGGVVVPDRSPSLKIGSVRGNFHAALSSLVNRKRAVVVTAPRVTAINNLTCQLQLPTTSVDVVMKKRGESIILQPRKGGPLKLETRITLNATPTINNDETVTIVMSSQMTQQTIAPLSSAGNSQNWFSHGKTQTIVANTRDGETIVLGGLLADWLPTDKAAPKIANKTTLLFVTARIIRRMEEIETAAVKP